MPKFEIGDIVYLKCRNEQLRGMVTAVITCPIGRLYMVGWGDGEDGRHYEIELTDTFTPDYL